MATGLPTVADFRRGGEGVCDVGQRLAPHFIRAEPDRNVPEYVHGLLLDGDRKNTWQLAERMRDLNPDAARHRLGPATWNADSIRGILRENAWDHPGDPQTVLVVNEDGTNFPPALLPFPRDKPYHERQETFRRRWRPALRISQTLADRSARGDSCRPG